LTAAPGAPGDPIDLDPSDEENGENGEPAEDAVGADDNGDEDPLTREQRLRKEAISMKHQLCHEPMNQFCQACQWAKHRRRPARRIHDRSERIGTKFGQHLTADIIIAHGPENQGIGQYKCVLVVKDLATNWLQALAAGDPHEGEDRPERHQCVETCCRRRPI
jgi:hypothetical protein